MEGLIAFCNTLTSALTEVCLFHMGWLKSAAICCPLTAKKGGAGADGGMSPPRAAQKPE